MSKKDLGSAQKYLFWARMDWLNSRTFENGYDYFIMMARVGTISLGYMENHLLKVLHLVTTSEQKLMYTVLKGWLENERTRLN